MIIASIFLATFLFAPFLGFLLLRYITGTQRQKTRLTTTANAVSIGILHPHSLSGGGGERVLWAIIAAICHAHPECKVVLYTLLPSSGPSTSDIQKRISSQFGLDISHAKFQAIDISAFSHISDAAQYPRLTLLLQALGMIYVGARAYLKQPCDIFLDTANLTFSSIIPRILGSTTMAYIHYPTISSDMVGVVREGKQGVNNTAAVASSVFKSGLKLKYYKLFALFYRFCGMFITVKIANSTWTARHLQYMFKEDVDVIYPPCNIQSATQRTSKAHHDRSREDGLIVSIGQFRPEKRHELQLSMMKDLRHRNCRLVMVGGVRNDRDQHRVNALRREIHELQLNIDIVCNATREEVIQWLQRAHVGIHSMRDEHFGISVVELMDAGLIVVAHSSGGVKTDIIEDGVSGFLAEDAQYAVKVAAALDMGAEQKAAMRREMQNRVHLFSEDRFRELMVATMSRVKRMCAPL